METAPEVKRKGIWTQSKGQPLEEIGHIFFTLLSEEDRLCEYMDEVVRMAEGKNIQLDEVLFSLQNLRIRLYLESEEEDKRDLNKANKIWDYHCEQ